MTVESQIRALIEEAALLRGMILSRRGVVRYGGVSPAHLRELLRSATEGDPAHHGAGSLEILGHEDPESFGHAPQWLDAGRILEEVASSVALEGPPDIVFCMDPWIAQLKRGGLEAVSASQWIWVSDVQDDRIGPHKEYWERLESWLEDLGFSQILTKVGLEQEESLPKRSSPVDRENRIHLARPGAWTWLRILGRPALQLENLFFLVRYSGSVAHLRIFLDSLRRQEGPRIDLQGVVLSAGPDPQLDQYIKWISLSQPELQLEVLDTLRGEGEEWKRKLNERLGKVGKTTLVLTGDHTVLSPSFVRTVRSGKYFTLRGTILSTDLTAHVLTGDVDLIPDHARLLEAFAKGTPSDCGRVLPSRQWQGIDDDASTRILSLVRESPGARSGGVLQLLELADLP